MIGVIARDCDTYAVREFFELFKTPWEYHVHGKAYDMVLCSGVPLRERDRIVAPLTVVYSAEEHEPRRFPVALTWKETCFPIFTGISVLEGEGIWIRSEEASNRHSAGKTNGKKDRTVRIGYNLFREVDVLLSVGQTREYATVATLEIHISILRELMVEAQVPFIEILPAPYGYNFIACLTHDIDFAGLRNHCFDRTMFGFLYRAVVLATFEVLRRKISWRTYLKKLRAAVLLPGVYLGLVEDYWARFDRYLKVERGLPSTFFFIPYKGVPGFNAPSSRRACKYDIADLTGTLSRIQAAGSEVGLHGIDAWHDPEHAKRERERIESVSRTPVHGVRVHWLCLSASSPMVIEQAGLSYDSTWGYNDAVGFRAGTAQAFRPIGTKSLLELPLLIQDTAMFYAARMGLSEKEALILCRSIVGNVSKSGGTLVINWHDRSLEPERLWGGFYMKLLHEIRARQPWFATGHQTAEWFGKRRRVAFMHRATRDGTVKVRLEGAGTPGGPRMAVRLHGPWKRTGLENVADANETSFPLDGEVEFEIARK